jgi:hypothetical protein
MVELLARRMSEEQDGKNLVTSTAWGREAARTRQSRRPHTHSENSYNHSLPSCTTRLVFTSYSFGINVYSGKEAILRGIKENSDPFTLQYGTSKFMGTSHGSWVLTMNTQGLKTLEHESKSIGIESKILSFCSKYVNSLKSPPPPTHTHVNFCHKLTRS